jgi:Glycosyl hydrolases family 35
VKPRPTPFRFNRCAWLITVAIAITCALPSTAQKSAPSLAQGVQIISVQGYPELRVDGRPFFVHAAEFSYYRVPPDLWSHSLDRFHELGINTIDLRIPWNWHEIRESEIDFDGHTNPRRDLRGLLKMISEKGFYLIARPGPAISDDWKNGGYPDWLIDAGPKQIPAAIQFDGKQVQRFSMWLAAVAHELAPYGSTKTPPARAENQTTSEPRASGRLLFIFLNDVPVIDTIGSASQASLQSQAGLRDALIRAGIESHFAATEPHVENGLSSANIKAEIPVTGEWYMKQPGGAAAADPKAAGARVTDEDAETLAFLAQNLRTQKDFPAMLSGFQAGWPAPSDDAGPERSAPSNTLLATRLLISQGVSGIEYSPLQDSLTPPGYQTTTANRDFRWNAALDLSGEKQERAHAVTRNGKFLEMWGEFLASSHPRAGIGLIDWRGGISQGDGLSSAQRSEAANQSRPMFQRIERVALFAGLPMELVSPGNQSTELLLHNSLLLLAIPDSLRGKSFLSAVAQTALLEYVRAGGVLFCNPERPQGPIFDEALKGATANPAGEGLSVTQVGRGRIVEWSKDFYSWLDPNESFAESFARQESHWAISALQNASQLANLRAPVRQSQENQTTLLVNELVPNEAAGMLAGIKSDCESHPRCVQGLLSVTNWSSGAQVQETLRFLPPAIDARVATESDYVELPVDLPARESLMLPLNVPLCSREVSSNDCPDRVVAAGAELLGVSRTGKSIELTLYAPTAATVIFHLRSTPLSVDLPNMFPAGARTLQMQTGRPPRRLRDPSAPPELGANGEPVLVIGDPSFPERTLHGTYDKGTGNFRVVVPRGAAPTFPRVLRLHLSYEPNLPETAKPAKQHGNGYRFSVADAVRLPLDDGKSLLSQPPIILVDKDRNGQFILESENLDDSSLTLQAAVSGAEQGTVSMRMTDEENDIETMKLHGNNSPSETSREGLLSGTMNVTGGHMPERTATLAFLVADADAPVHYEYDFERSGSKNWILENKRLRLILLPAVGGEISALVDKTSGVNLTTTVGGLRDLIRVQRNLGTALESQLLDPTMNVAYSAEWTSKDGAEILMKARWPADAPIAGEISKTVRMTEKNGTEIVEAEYRLNSEVPGERNNPAESTRNEHASFVTAFSVPAIADQRDGTQFCWLPHANPSQPATEAGATVPDNSAHCTAFALNGSEMQIPAGVERLEVRTPGRPTLAMEWTAGRVTIQQKLYSARILLEFPAHAAADSAPNSGAQDASYVVRYIVERTQ